MTKTTFTPETHPTCTVRSAITGECGEPGVQIVETPSGGTFVECATHASPPVGRIVVRPIDGGDAIVATFRPDFSRGDEVVVRHGGISKVGVVVAVRTTRVDVRVPVADGRDEKVITRGVTEIEHVR